MVCANVTGFFYTVWTCFKGEEEDGAEAKPGFMENMSLSFARGPSAPPLKGLLSLKLGFLQGVP